MTSSRSDSPYVLKRAELEQLQLERYTHQHNEEAVRYTASLTDPLGFTDMGVHLVRITPSTASSEHHFHEEDEEFVYVLEGRGCVWIGDEAIEIEAGDFMAFPKNSPAHHLENTSSVDLLCLVGGTRAPIDICNYPRLRLRQYRVHGVREWVRDDALTRMGLQPWVKPPKDGP